MVSLAHIPSTSVRIWRYVGLVCLIVHIKSYCDGLGSCLADCEGQTCEYQSKTMRAQIYYASYDAQLCPVIAKGQRAPNAQLTHQIVNRHHEELKSSGPDSQTHKNPV